MLYRNLKIKALIGIIGLLFLSNGLFSQDKLEPVKWSIEVESSVEGKVQIAFNATVDEHWHVYHTTISDDPDAFGPMPTELFLEENESVTIVGSLFSKSEPIMDYDSAFDMNVYYFENEATFLQELSLEEGSSSVVVKGSLSYMACDDEKCIFPDPLSFEIDIEEK